MDPAAIAQLLSALDAHLTDEHVLDAAQEWLTAVDYDVEYDDEIVVIPRDVDVRIVKKSLILDRHWGAHLTADVVFDPLVDEDGRYSSVCFVGTLKIIFDLAGKYTDEVFSRAMVIDRE